MEKLDKYWDDIHLKYNSIYDGWLNKYISLFKKEDLFIELGCGRAYCSRYLLENNFENVIACDFSNEVIKIVNKEAPNLRTMIFDMSEQFPFEDNSVDVIISDLSLHYFDLKKTQCILGEIYRVLKVGGYVIARVNSSNDKSHIPNNCTELEKNYFWDGNIYKKFFEKEDFDILFKNFEICNLEEKIMDRYERTKILWEFCIKKEFNKND